MEQLAFPKDSPIIDSASVQETGGESNKVREMGVCFVVVVV